MTTRIERLFQKFVETQELTLKMYKNVCAIQGQYDKQLCTQSKVMMKEVQSKLDKYQAIINKTYTDEDISVEGYEAIYAMLQSRKELIRNNTKINNHEDLIRIAERNAKDFITIVDTCVEMVEANEIERTQLLNALKQIRIIEGKDYHFIEHIMTSSKKQEPPQ